MQHEHSHINIIESQTPGSIKMNYKRAPSPLIHNRASDISN